jgi:hypothetical protein
VPARAGSQTRRRLGRRAREGTCVAVCCLGAGGLASCGLVGRRRVVADRLGKGLYVTSELFVRTHAHIKSPNQPTGSRSA